MNKGVDSEQMGSYNEFEQMIKEQCISDDVADALRMFAQATVDTADTLKRFAELCSIQTIQIEEGKETAILEQRKKHCKNYLELKQINRRLNILKFKQNKRSRG